MPQDALLQAILDRPEEDAPRLVYADWLEEHGQAERAEFIRAQIERQRLPAGDPRRAALKRREKKLLAAHGQRWTQELPTWARKEPVYRRGFVTEVGASTESFVGRGEALFRAAPIRLVRLTKAVRHLAELAASPLLGRLAGLDLYANELGEAGVQALAASPHLGRLRSLNLSCTEVGPAGVAALAQAPALGALAKLDLGGNAVGLEGVRALTSSTCLTGLTRLVLQRTELGPAEAEVLAGAARTARLKALNLAYNRLGDAGVQALAGSPHLAGLGTLVLSENRIGGEGAKALAGSPHLGGLKRLKLDGNRISAANRTLLSERFGSALRM
jgi:uncharacterized protein (TIGR02996 family)